MLTWNLDVETLMKVRWIDGVFSQPTRDWGNNVWICNRKKERGWGRCMCVCGTPDLERHTYKMIKNTLRYKENLLSTGPNKRKYKEIKVKGWCRSSVIYTCYYEKKTDKNSTPLFHLLWTIIKWWLSLKDGFLSCSRTQCHSTCILLFDTGYRTLINLGPITPGSPTTCVGFTSVTTKDETKIIENSEGPNDWVEGSLRSVLNWYPR